MILSFYFLNGHFFVYENEIIKLTIVKQILTNNCIWQLDNVRSNTWSMVGIRHNDKRNEINGMINKVDASSL